jgi:hypothetical protein
VHDRGLEQVLHGGGLTGNPGDIVIVAVLWQPWKPALSRDNADCAIRLADLRRGIFTVMRSSPPAGRQMTKPQSAGLSNLDWRGGTFAGTEHARRSGGGGEGGQAGGGRLGVLGGPRVALAAVGAPECPAVGPDGQVGGHGDAFLG